MSRSGLSSIDRAAIALGGVVGATCRWAIGRALHQSPTDGGWFTYEPSTSTAFPTNAELVAGRWGTVTANLFGCLLLGAIATLLVRTSPSQRRLLMAAGTGFCGALTTFATFAVEAVILLRLEPFLTALPVFGSPGESVGEAIAYLALSLVGGVAAFWLGRIAARQWVQQ